MYIIKFVFFSYFKTIKPKKYNNCFEIFNYPGKLPGKSSLNKESSPSALKPN